MNKIVGGIAAHYFVSIVGGARMSPLGLLAELIAQFFKTQLVEGPQKQFANMCGFFFSFPAAVMLLWAEQDVVDDTKIAASVFLACLAGAAACEGFIGFCFGCFFFNLFVKIGLISKNVNEKCYASLEDTQNFVDQEYERPTLITPIIKNINQGPKGVKTPVDYKYKTTSTDYKDYDQHFIRHMKVEYFVSALGVTGIALLWRYSSDFSKQFDSGRDLWRSFAIIAAIWFGFLLLLYILKCVLYPNKIVKEWYHPVKYNAFSCIPITILLFAGIAFKEGEKDEYEDMQRFYRALFWIGSMTQLFLATWSVGIIYLFIIYLLLFIYLFIYIIIIIIIYIIIINYRKMVF